MATEKKKRVFEMNIEDCVECPAHICLGKIRNDGRCRCAIVDRIVPEIITIGFDFPKWCPLPEVEKDV
jgi:hypothetical protein